jgi:hypothetical protein
MKEQINIVLFCLFFINNSFTQKKISTTISLGLKNYRNTILTDRKVRENVIPVSLGIIFTNRMSLYVNWNYSYSTPGSTFKRSEYQSIGFGIKYSFPS